MDLASNDRWLLNFFSKPNRIQWINNELKGDYVLKDTIKEAEYWLQNKDNKMIETPILS